MGEKTLWAFLCEGTLFLYGWSVGLSAVAGFRVRRGVMSVLGAMFSPRVPIGVCSLKLVCGVSMSRANRITVSVALATPGYPTTSFVVRSIQRQMRSVRKIASAVVGLIFRPR